MRLQRLVRFLPLATVAAVLPLVAAPVPRPAAKAGRILPLALAPGDAAPPVRGEMLDGGRFRAVWRDHRVTVVNFWAVWCVPCKDEMPVLAELYRSKKDAGLGVVGVEVGREAADASREFLAKAGVTYPVVVADDSAVADWGGVSIYPTTFLVGSDGKIVRKYVGASPDDVKALVEDVDLLLAGKPLGTRPLASPPPAVSSAPR